jgi:protein required for attachment to host cells
MKKDTWIVVANSSFARIFKAENNKLLTELEVLEHPESRQHPRDLVTSKPGRTFDRVGTGRHAMEPETSPKEQEFIIFARQLTANLDAARSDGRFGKLYLIASPVFLGILRQTLSTPTSQLIAGEISKDITHLDKDQIREHLPLVL